ncbi:MAG: PHA/PHB synthase family protein, partial [Candidatus Nucleicultricaceae bacterium]
MVQETDQKENTKTAVDPYKMATFLVNVGQRLQNIAQKSALKKQKGESYYTIFNPRYMMESFQEAFVKIMENPKPFLEAGGKFLRDYQRLTLETYKSLWSGTALDDVVEAERGDKRFSGEAWDKTLRHNYLKQSYLLWHRWMNEITQDLEGIDPKAAHKVQFYTRQIADALSPSNYMLLNPEASKKAMETGGESVFKGVANFLRDLDEGDGHLSIKMVKREAFELGQNIAITPGKVVYQNDLIQLIQYAPTTKTVFQYPILLIPPCINRFYIFDLRPNNSFVKWLIDQGFTVFMVSWVNPDQKLAHKRYEDYVFEGVRDAARVMKEITGEEKVNALGYCIGGNFLATYSGYAGGTGDESLNTTSYLATLFDFENSGDLQVFIDEKQLDDIETRAKTQGYLDGETLARTFNILRANDLIWSFVINNYLLGEEPMAFDLLYWNSHSTNLPATMFTYYLRNMFHHNLLIKPGGITVGGRPLNLADSKTPAFIFNTKDD